MFFNQAQLKGHAAKKLKETCGNHVLLLSVSSSRVCARWEQQVDRFQVKVMVRVTQSSHPLLGFP